MDIKKFLTWENAGKFAAAYVAADILLGGGRKRTPHVGKSDQLKTKGSQPLQKRGVTKPCI